MRLVCVRVHKWVVTNGAAVLPCCGGFCAGPHPTATMALDNMDGLRCSVFVICVLWFKMILTALMTGAVWAVGRERCWARKG